MLLSTTDRLDACARLLDPSRPSARRARTDFREGRDEVSYTFEAQSERNRQIVDVTSNCGGGDVTYEGEACEPTRRRHRTDGLTLEALQQICPPLTNCESTFAS